MKRYVVIGGAKINDYETIKKYLSHDDYFVYCDCGLNHQEKLGFAPDLVIGDFDTHEKPNHGEIITLSTIKDETDTVYAVQEGIRRGFQDYLLIGTTGGKMDHTLANIYTLLMIRNYGGYGKIIDDYSEIELIISGEQIKIDSSYKFFSILNITNRAKGITITGSKFDIDNSEIKSEYQYGVSNEVLNDEAIVRITDGELLVIKIR